MASEEFYFIKTQLRQVWGSFVKELRIIFNLLSAQRQLYNRILQPNKTASHKSK